MAHEPQDKAGRPYHIRLSKEEAARIALLPGDPGRVKTIAAELHGSKELSTNREYTAYSGTVGGEKVLVMSTGIGGPAAAIAVEELARLGVRVMIRVGTCGSISRSVRVGSVVIADAAVRMDGTSHQYVQSGYPAAATPEVVVALQASAARLRVSAHVGVVASTDSFYVGQGREGYGRYFPSDKSHLIKDLQAARVLCFEMEAATLFTLGRLFGLKTGAVMAVVGNRVTNEFSPGAGVQKAIEVAVGSIKDLKTNLD